MIFSVRLDVPTQRVILMAEDTEAAHWIAADSCADETMRAVLERHPKFEISDASLRTVAAEIEAEFTRARPGMVFRVVAEFPR